MHSMLQQSGPPGMQAGADGLSPFLASFAAILLGLNDDRLSSEFRSGSARHIADVCLWECQKCCSGNILPGGGQPIAAWTNGRFRDCEQPGGTAAIGAHSGCGNEMIGACASCRGSPYPVLMRPEKYSRTRPRNSWRAASIPPTPDKAGALSEWAAWARKAGSILWAEVLIARASATASGLADGFPPSG